MQALSKSHVLKSGTAIILSIAALSGVCSSGTAQESNRVQPAEVHQNQRLDQSGDRGTSASSAVSSFQSALINAFLEVGNIYVQLGYPDDAIRSFSNVIEFEPDNASAYLNRGGAYLELGEREAGIADLEQAAALYQERGEIETYQEIQERINEVQ